METSQRVRFCVSRDGTRIAAAESGNGPIVVRAGHRFSHLELDRKNRVWRHWLRALSNGHTLVRYDPRGCGLSDWNVADLSFDSWVDDLAAVVASSTAASAAVPIVGLSHGAAVAVAYAAQQPKRVSRLVLCSAFVRGRISRSASPRDREESELVLKLAELGWHRDDPAYRHVFSMQFQPDSSPEQQQALDMLQHASSSPQNAVRTMRTLWNIDIRDLAPRVACPTLVFSCRGDSQAPFDEGRQLAALIPGARFVALESRNHILVEDEPAWAEMVAEMNRFLAGDVAEAEPALEPLPEISPRQFEILDLIAGGVDNQAIAERLGLSEKTVRNHINGLFARLDVSSRAQAIVLARNAGLGKGRRGEITAIGGDADRPLRRPGA